MDLVELLAKLPTIRKNGFLRYPGLYSWDTHFVSHVCDRLENLGAVVESQIRPSKSCIEHQKWKNKSERFYSKLYKPKPVNQDILKALKRQMDIAMEKNVTKTSKSIMVIMDCHNLSTSYCNYKRFVHADMAAAVAALHLAQTAGNASLLVFKGITLEYIEPRMSVEELVDYIGTDTWDYPSTREISLYLNPLNGETLDTDLFVVIGANINLDDYMKNVEDHRKKNPRAPKFAFCSLGGIRNDRTFKFDKDVLLTSGFDDKMCDIITAFSLL
ncbi:uncharacterized protein LOC106669037 [Cimex lectularius]|uniref:Uncharacterized protein n=1 Tax=Cimex lectularius TaxID=79782 RepID=A0A8I6RY08_CIMLE|nr:uncharacterized protein LOC106669037 [Cimex lectularius]